MDLIKDRTIRFITELLAKDFEYKYLNKILGNKTLKHLQPIDPELRTELLELLDCILGEDLASSIINGEGSIDGRCDMQTLQALRHYIQTKSRSNQNTAK